MILGILQNAHSYLYAGGVWPRESWLKALWRSRSGQRLRVLQEKCIDEIWWDNTTPIVGETPDSVVKPDEKHLRMLLRKPITRIVTFGKQAEAAILKYNTSSLPHLILPHPACRVVTNKCFEAAVRLLNTGSLGIRGTIKIDCKGLIL